MRTALLAVAVCVLGGLAFPAEACESCSSYFDYQTNSWCDFCQADNCGYFNCSIRVYEGLGGEYCTGDDPGCFTVGSHCPREPRYDGSLQERLDDHWRLSCVEILKTPAQES